MCELLSHVKSKSEDDLLWTEPHSHSTGSNRTRLLNSITHIHRPNAVRTQVQMRSSTLRKRLSRRFIPSAKPKKTVQQQQDFNSGFVLFGFGAIIKGIRYYSLNPLLLLRVHAWQRALRLCIMKKIHCTLYSFYWIPTI